MQFFQMAKSAVLDKVLLRLKKHADVQDQDILVVTKQELLWNRYCDCPEPQQGDIYCRHGNRIPKKGTIIRTEIFLKDWGEVMADWGRTGPILFWKEGIFSEKALFVPFNAWDTRDEKKLLSELFGDRKSFLIEYRKRRLEKFCWENEELKRENEQLRKANEKFSVAFEQLYAPGGILAEEAREHFESLQ
ncbi:hypothetical protein [Brazilian marseillevirus]|uniref:hypothetical protein n=1 Tax=Brazilian marseillevirus TaxID=1813599 RepID=UPI000781648C|nr:hypothetical protein A3303_gp015 [Brazilian marseillevirus]AMQ10523.1 hypothetical protein [Brazilian marseillevirus]